MEPKNPKLLFSGLLHFFTATAWSARPPKQSNNHGSSSISGDAFGDDEDGEIGSSSSISGDAFEDDEDGEISN